MVSEVALALMLLIGAGLLMRSLTSLRAVDPGFDARNVLTASIGMPMAKYDTEAQRNQFFDRVRQDVSALPGVVSAAWIDSLPMQGGSTQYVAVEGASAGAGLRAADGGGAAARRPVTSPRRASRCWPAATSPRPTASAGPA